MYRNHHVELTNQKCKCSCHCDSTCRKPRHPALVKQQHRHLCSILSLTTRHQVMSCRSQRWQEVFNGRTSAWDPQDDAWAAACRMLEQQHPGCSSSTAQDAWATLLMSSWEPALGSRFPWSALLMWTLEGTTFGMHSVALRDGKAHPLPWGVAFSLWVVEMRSIVTGQQSASCTAPLYSKDLLRPF